MSNNSTEKNKNKRLELMISGAEDLEQWIFDLIRQGLAVLDGKTTMWDEMAARMVDAKMGGIAHRLRELRQIKTDDWPEEVLKEFGRLYLLTQGFKNFEDMPPLLKTQLQLVGGVTVRKKDLIEEPSLLDDWLVLGQWHGVNIDQAAYRKIWMQGKELQQMALLMEYDYQGGGFEGHFPLGAPIKAAVVYYPGAFPQRIMIKHRYPPEKTSTQLLAYSNIAAMQKEYALAIGAHPWLGAFPCALEKMKPLFHNDQFFLIDEHNDTITLETKPLAGWTLLSVSGGQEVVVFGEWRGERLFPLTVFADGSFVDLGKYNSVKPPNRFKKRRF